MSDASLRLSLFSLLQPSLRPFLCPSHHQIPLTLISKGLDFPPVIAQSLDCPLASQWRPLLSAEQSFAANGRQDPSLFLFSRDVENVLVAMPYRSMALAIWLPTINTRTGTGPSFSPTIAGWQRRLGNGHMIRNVFGLRQLDRADSMIQMLKNSSTNEDSQLRESARIGQLHLNGPSSQSTPSHSRPRRRNDAATQPAG